MSSLDPFNSARARLAVAVRDGRHEDADRARRDLAAARVERAVRTDLATLRESDRLHLASVLVGGGADDGQL